MLAPFQGLPRVVETVLLAHDPHALASPASMHIALAALRGLGIESLVAPDEPQHVEEVIARFRAWFARRPTTAG